MLGLNIPGYASNFFGLLAFPAGVFRLDLRELTHTVVRGTDVGSCGRARVQHDRAQCTPKHADLLEGKHGRAFLCHGRAVPCSHLSADNVCTLS